MSTEKTIPSGSPSDYQLAATVARHVELESIYLVSLDAKIKVPMKQAAGAMLDGDIEAALDWKTRADVDETANQLVVTVAYGVRVVPNGTSHAGEVAAFSAEFNLEYSLSSLPPEEDRADLFRAFANFNGVYNSWPYLREVVQSTCSRMALPPLILPVYRVAKPPRTEGQGDSGTSRSERELKSDGSK